MTIAMFLHVVRHTIVQNQNIEIFQNILEIYAGGEAHHNVEPTRGGFRDARTVKGLGEKVINIIVLSLIVVIITIISYLHEMIILYYHIVI